MPEFLLLEWLRKPVWMWTAFLSLIVFLLAFDLGVLNRDDKELGVKQSLLLSAFYIAIAVLFVNLSRQLQSQIHLANDELAALEVIVPMDRLVQAAQQHRGLSSGVINGDASLLPKREAKTGEVKTALQGLGPILPASVAASEEWKKINEEWNLIAADGLSWTATESFAAHTRLIAAILQLKVDVADESGLTIDPNMDSYYLLETAVVKLPSMLERLGQTRAKGPASWPRRASTITSGSISASSWPRFPTPWPPSM